MRLIIAGGPEYEFTVEDHVELQNIHARYHLVEVIITGWSELSDCAAIWARLSSVPVRSFETAGLPPTPQSIRERDARMLDHATALALFPGKFNLDLLHAEATRRGLKIFDFRHPA